APPLYIQEKVPPKVPIDGLLRRSKEAERAGPENGDRHPADKAFPSTVGPPGREPVPIFLRCAQCIEEALQLRVLGSPADVEPLSSSRGSAHGFHTAIRASRPWGIGPWFPSGCRGACPGAVRSDARALDA